MSVAVLPLHMGALHPYEQALTLLLAFGPFVALALVLRRRNRELAAEDEQAALDQQAALEQQAALDRQGRDAQAAAAVPYARDEDATA